MEKTILKIAVVFFMVGAGILASSAVLYGIKIFTLNETLEFFCIGMGFGAVGSVLRAIYINSKNKRR